MRVQVLGQAGGWMSRAGPETTEGRSFRLAKGLASFLGAPTIPAIIPAINRHPPAAIRDGLSSGRTAARLALPRLAPASDFLPDARGAAVCGVAPVLRAGSQRGFLRAFSSPFSRAFSRSFSARTDIAQGPSSASGYLSLPGQGCFGVRLGLGRAVV